MSLSKWKRLAQKRTETGRMKNQLYDEITEAKIKSKTSDARITKSFRLDEIIEGLRAQKPKNRPQKRIRPPAGKPDEIDYAPEVDPYEDMDVEGLLDLQDYVAPQAEKQIAKIPKGPPLAPPKYEMDPSFWNLEEEGDESLPPEYSFVEDEKGEGPLAIEPPPDDDDDDDEDLDIGDINRNLDSADLPNYNDVEKRLAQPEMTPVKRSKYLESNIKKANSEISSITSKFKTNTTKRLNQAIKK